MARALAPLGALYAEATRRRLARGPWETVGVPVICVGNIAVGGTGKTPTVRALAARLGASGAAVHVLLRGHGGTEPGPLRVTPEMPAARVGDEALLHAIQTPTWVARDRLAGARAAAAAGADLVILDDGFQNPSLAKDLSLIVVDAETGFGNGRCLPAGPLREPAARGLARADAVVLIGPPEARARVRFDLPTVEARIVPVPTGLPWQDLPVLAFAGIGRPEKFFATLRGLGARLVAEVALQDHARLNPKLLARLARQASAARATLVTTEKDAVRLPAAWRRRVITLPVALEADWTPIETLLERVLPQPGG